jgi:hypothetical protein
MGQIWLAEQKQPVRRRVALKLIKTGYDSQNIVRRFESERQAVALMDHPAPNVSPSSTRRGISLSRKRSGAQRLHSSEPIPQTRMDKSLHFG